MARVRDPAPDLALLSPDSGGIQAGCPARVPRVASRQRDTACIEPGGCCAGAERQCSPHHSQSARRPHEAPKTPTLCHQGSTLGCSTPPLASPTSCLLRGAPAGTFPTRVCTTGHDQLWDGSQEDPQGGNRDPQGGSRDPWVPQPHEEGAAAAGKRSRPRGATAHLCVKYGPINPCPVVSYCLIST